MARNEKKLTFRSPKVIYLKILLSFVLAVGGSEHSKCHPDDSNCVSKQNSTDSELPVLHVRLASFEDAAEVLASLNGSHEAWVTREEVRMDLKGGEASTVTRKETCDKEEGQRTPGWVKRLFFVFVPLEKSHSFELRRDFVVWRVDCYDEKLRNFSQNFKLLETFIFVFAALST